MVELSELSYYRYCRITVCYLIGRRSGHQNMVELSRFINQVNRENYPCQPKIYKVLEISQPLWKSNRNIKADNWLTPVELVVS
ncbi:hypothetical protein LAZ67_18001775 [Cordylochernes scorpioides]|uniref:Uncharacterized protein n=1 Tax=Cordylochernes scorpioides TaxID=51811 RepID=A0ABY6LG14_9ARAC|nr:hypothetical protein LAZ67_18001775 [Cordylochernes scorpioides]